VLYDIEVIHRHTVRVALAPERALHYFTPAGERAWAPGWDPHFPAGERGDGAQPGTVFLTGASCWIVVDREADRVRYARVTPGVRAGTIEVRVRPDGDGSLADVVYDTTALGDEPFDPHIADWEEAISAALAAS
jgi:hypothetical protein